MLTLTRLHGSSVSSRHTGADNQFGLGYVAPVLICAEVLQVNSVGHPGTAAVSWEAVLLPRPRTAAFLETGVSVPGCSARVQEADVLPRPRMLAFLEALLSFLRRTVLFLEACLQSLQRAAASLGVAPRLADVPSGGWSCASRRSAAARGAWSPPPAGG